MAAENGHAGVVAQLLAKLTPEQIKTAVNKPDSAGLSPLYWAAQNDHEAVVAALLDVGAAVDQADHWGNTPLHMAAQKGHEAIVDRLLRADPAVDQPNQDGWTALHWAALMGHAGIVEQLLKAGNAVDQLNTLDQTPLHWAAQEGHEAVVARLLEAGADLNAADKSGQTPLSMAIEEKHATTILLLAHHTFKALIKHEAEKRPKAGGAQAAGEQSSGAPEKTKSQHLKVQLEALLTEPSDLFRPSQAALLEWIIGKHVGFQDGVTEQDLIQNIHLDDLKAIMLPEKDLAALSITSDKASIHHDLPRELQQHMKSYLTQDLLLQELKEKIEQKEKKAATTIQRRVRGNQARRRAASARGGAGGGAAAPRAERR